MKMDQSMIIYENRLKTFEGWPYVKEDGATCTAESLANAGFFRPNPESEPDSARCIMCYKDLEGWEPEDVPEQEHVKRCPNCPFILQKTKDIKQMTMENFIRFCYQHSINQLQEACKKNVAELRRETKERAEELKITK